MKRLILSAVLVHSLLLAPTLLAQGSEVTFQSTELAPGLFMIEGVGGFGGGNVGLLTGDDGVVLVDDSMPPLTAKLLEAVKSVADGPVDFVVNTHVHGDHMAGNAMLTEAGATVVAHDNVRGRLVRDGMSMGPGNPVPTPKDMLPVLTFADAVTFHLNGQEAYVFHVEHAHTDGDAIIHFKEADVIHAGDVFFNKVFPFIDLDNGGSVDGYVAAQKRIVEMAGESTKIIPGHGPLASRTDLESSLAMLVDARDKIASMVEEGKSLDQVMAAKPLKDYESQSWNFITTERMITQVYRGVGGDTPEASDE